MTKRLNDTAAIVGMVPYESQSEHYSRTVRKIDNGYLTTHYGSNPNDPEGPTHKEVFTTQHPDQLDDPSGSGMGVSSMKKAVDCLKGKY